jgi:hypothetical protein
MRRLWLIAPLALVLALVIVAVSGDDERARDTAPVGGGRARDVLRVDKAGWKTDFSRHSVPLSEFQSGGPPRDGIPPIDEPRPTSEADADKWLAAREPVLAVELGGQARAYPIQILIWHEIANDTLGGRPIAVTYCDELQSGHLLRPTRLEAVSCSTASPTTGCRPRSASWPSSPKARPWSYPSAGSCASRWCRRR